MPPGAPWPLLARQWPLLGPPLRPSPEDIAVLERLVLALAPRVPPAPPRVVLLGVTPEIATLAWPAGTELTAVDQNPAMIDLVWPVAGAPAGAKAVVGDWRALPVEDDSVDLVLGDAATTLVPYPHDTEALFGEAARVLRASGSLVLRTFVPPHTREPVSVIAGDLSTGRIATLDALKLRLLMALHLASDRGVRLADAWDAWREIAPDPGALAAQLGWSPDVLETIDVYRDSATTYSFPSIEQLDVLARRARLDAPTIHVPSYALGDRCPTIAWRKI